MMRPSIVYKTVSNGIIGFRLRGQDEELKTYLEYVSQQALLAASLAEHSADINYRIAFAVYSALTNHGHGSYATEILDMLKTKPKMNVHTMDEGHRG
jgi:hypothetical protein